MTSSQAIVAKFNQANDLCLEQSVRMLDLASEVGELCKLGFSGKTGSEVGLMEWQEELGDTLYSLLSLMCEMDIDAHCALNGALEKYSQRKSRSGFIRSDA